MRVTQAVILAGGLGTRLRPLTLTTPKPMVRIQGKPFLEYIVRLLVKNNIKEIIILTGYLGDQIKTYFKDGERFNVKITYSDSGVAAGTGLRLKNAQHLLKEQFLLLYGDNYWPLALPKLQKHLASKKTEALVTVYSNIDNYTKSNMFVSQGIVEVYDKKRETGRTLNGVDIGFFILQKKHIEILPNTDSSFEEIVLPYLISKKQLAGFYTHHRYYGLSNLDRMDNIKKYFKPKKVVFLDRDGVINKKAPEGEYVKNWKEFEFLPNSIKALKLLSKGNYQIYIITNQAGIARGKMSIKDLEIIHKNLKGELRKQGIHVSGIYFCPHGWDEGCFCRKPNPGMLFQAVADHALELFDAIFIGDDERDMLAAKAADVKGYLVSKENSFYDIVRSIL